MEGWGSGSERVEVEAGAEAGKEREEREGKQPGKLK